jgi:dienelactone hydrolase
MEYKITHFFSYFLLNVSFFHQKISIFAVFNKNEKQNKNNKSMKKIAVCSLGLWLSATALLMAQTSSQDIPLVYDHESPRVALPPVEWPAFAELPRVCTLPDPFAFQDASRSRSTAFADWEVHRAEIIRQLEHYEIGEKPKVDRSQVRARLLGDTLCVTVKAGGESLTLHALVKYPAMQRDVYPAVIGMGWPSGSLPPQLFEERGVVQIAFNFPEVMSHTQKRGEEPINRLYPDRAEMGAYAAWPWGVSRLIDGLEQLRDELHIDTRHLCVTGCSFAGKMALFAGALDERIALTIAQEPGGGGANAWRVSETLGEVERIHNTNYAWFKESMRQFGEQEVDRLPIDHHQLVALVAPRALLVLGNTDYAWLADESGYVSCRAARRVWEAFGVEDRMGYSIEGGHPHCMLPESQWPEVSAFIDRFLLDQPADTYITRAPMFESVDWEKWLWKE